MNAKTQGWWIKIKLLKLLNYENSKQQKERKEELGYVATEWDADGMRP